jgi:5-methylcytosine-specific restriction protein A
MWAIAGQTARTRHVATSSPSKGWYDSAWEKRRRAFLAMHPDCGMRPNGLAPVMSQCAERGHSTRATHVDHVRPYRGDRALFDDPLNVQGLCASCHSRKTKAGL